MISVREYFLMASLLGAVLFSGCSKENSLSPYELGADNIRVFDDDSMALPVEIIAGNNCLLSAYNSRGGEVKFNLTDNNGNLLWQKQFGINYISGMLKEEDGTFSVFSAARRIHFDSDGTVIDDNTSFLSFYNTYYTIIHVVIDRKNNYLFYGSYYTGGSTYSFAASIDHDGAVVFKKFYTLNTIITGCEFTADTGYFFFGHKIPTLFITSSSFFIMKAGSNGVSQWQKTHLLSENTNQSAPFSFSQYGFYTQACTHEIFESSDSTYICFANIPDYVSSDQRARIYKIDSGGELLDSAYIDLGTYNRFSGGRSNSYSLNGLINYLTSFTSGYGVVKNSDGSFYLYMQNGFFGTTGPTNSFPGASQSFFVHLDPSLSIRDIRYIQNSYSDCFTSVCKTSTGKTAAFGMIASLGGYYKPILIFNDIDN